MALKTVEELAPVKRYIERIGAHVDKMKHATIRVMDGKYFKEVGSVTFTQEGEVTASAGYEPTPEERESIKYALKNAEWPIYRFIREDEPRPKAVIEADKKDVFEFKDHDGNIVMIQVRMELKKGERAYVPFTQYNDDVWRAMHPEGEYPLWGLENVTQGCTVIISEGAKSARRMQRMIEQKTRADKELYASHPWATELDHAVHIGFIGGAYATDKTNWGVLRKLGVRNVIIVADNDRAGQSVVPLISRAVNLPCWWIQFTGAFPVAHDLGDDFPPNLFREIKGKRYYVGPAFEDLLQFGTWATDVVLDPDDPKGKKTSVFLRDSFREQWAYLDNQALFVCARKPEMMYDKDKFNMFAAGWSDTPNLAAKILQRRIGTISRYTYRPDIDAMVVNDEGVPALNIYRKPKIKAVAGDTTPFLEFMAYMVPDEKERHEVMRWCATLIARPEVRMRYALLMISENQGIGKTTLGESILMPLLGEANVSKPSVKELEDKYNGYIGMKRLAIVDELYGSKKLYNQMKSMVSDDYVNLREMYRDGIKIRNWVTVYGTSNSEEALSIEKDDRRWLIPKLAEDAWPRAKFAEFNDWLFSGGLSIVKFWAEQFGDYVATGERAPKTRRKAEIVEEARMPAEREAYRLASIAVETGAKCSMSSVAVEQWVRDGKDIRQRVTAHNLLKAMQEAGMIKTKYRTVVGGFNQYLIMTPSLWEDLRNMDEADQKKQAKDWIRSPDKVLEQDM